MALTVTRQYNIDAGIVSSLILLGAVRFADGADEGPAASVRLTGTVRDFLERTELKGHPDFEVVPDHGYGLYCGNVSPFLGHDGRPVFTGAGRLVTVQSNDELGQPIAPHLSNRRFEPNPVSPTECAVLKDSKGKDAFDVCLTDAVFNGDGTSTWTYHVRELPGGKDLSHWNLKLDATHKVLPGTTPGYDFGVDGSTGFFGIKWDVTDGFSEGDFTIVLAGEHGGVNDAAGVLAKGGPSPDTGELFIPSTAPSLTGSPFPPDAVLVGDPSLGDDDASLSYSDAGGIDSAKSFKHWFRDKLGVNLARPLTLTFHQQDDGTHVFDSKDDPTFSKLGGFFPIEGKLFGNPGGSPDRNFHFTFELHAKFTYDESADQYLRVVGDDDIWVYIDGQLAIDLGGVHDTEEQVVDLGRLDLQDGQTYDIVFFFAERHRSGSNLRLETNLDLEPGGRRRPSMTAAAD